MPFPPRNPVVVACIASGHSLVQTSAEEFLEHADIAEIRLDLLVAEGLEPRAELWAHWHGRVPLLFTARCAKEGSPIALDAGQRHELLSSALTDAWAIDVELNSTPELSAVLALAARSKVPWLASHHDFFHLPESSQVTAMQHRAQALGATLFKLAAMPTSIEDLASLCHIQQTAIMPTATMGMGALAAASRLLCVQHGSLLNYGSFGREVTAPGQLPAKLLKSIIACLPPRPA